MEQKLIFMQNKYKSQIILSQYEFLKESGFYKTKQYIHHFIKYSIIKKDDIPNIIKFLYSNDCQIPEYKKQDIVLIYTTLWNILN